MGAQFETLARMIAPISVKTFLEEYYEKKALVVTRNQPDYYESLLTMSEVDRVVTTMDLYHPAIRMVSAKRDLQRDEYAYADGMIDVARMYKLFADGATIVCNQLNRFVPSLGDFCRGLEREMSTRFQTNTYLTPVESQGLPVHFDSHDVFVLQVHGSKSWKVYGTPVELPLQGQGFTRDAYEAGTPTMEFVMRPGDMLYMPRGLMHNAITTEGESLHITCGLLHNSWTELLLEAVAAVALTDPEFRKTLPPGFARADFDRGTSEAQFRKLLGRVLERADFHRALDHFADDLVTTRTAALRGQLTEVLTLAEVNGGTRVGCRPNLLLRVRTTDTQIVASCFGGDISLPIHAAESLQYALETPDFRVRDLPGDLDEAGKVVLVKRLIREGLVHRLG